MATSYASNAAFTGFFKPTRFEGEIYDCEVWGDIPNDLVGTFYRLQPDPEYLPAAGSDHPMAGDGHVSMFRFVGAGHVDFRSRYVKTARLEAQRRAGKALAGGTASTGLVFHAGKLLAFGEEGPAMELDPDTLQTKGAVAFGGRLANAGPRPKVDPKTGELIAYGMRGDQVTVVTADKGGRVIGSASFKAPYAAMIHDIAITPRYVVVPLTGMAISADRARAGKVAYGWDKTKPVAVALVPRGGGEVKWFTGPARYAVRTINAAEEGSKVVLTLPVADVNPDPLYPNLDGSPQGGGDPSIRRWTMDTAGGGAIAETVAYPGAGFAAVDGRYLGQPSRYVFKGLADPDKPFDEAKGGALKGRVVNSYQKLDLTTGQAQAYFVGDAQGLQECVFAPRSAAAAEGDGYLIGVANNYAEKKTDLVIVDANALEKGAIATVKLPFRLRPGSHGVWTPVSAAPFAVFSPEGV